MKQKSTKFEKVSSRQFAYLFLGIGAIGLSLTVGDFGLGTAAWPSFIMLGGFAVATVFLFLAGGAPVPTGVEDYETEDKIQVVMSDDLNNEIKAKVGKAILEITQNHEQSLSMFGKAAEEFAGKVTALQSTLDKANVSGVAEQLNSLTGAIDLRATSEALGSLTGSMTSLLSNLDDLSNLSSNSTTKLETIISDVTEDLQATQTGLKEKSKGITKELDSTLNALSAFNRV